jgi:hypothetical protein
MVDPKTVKDIADIATAIVPVKQVYEDALQPAARQVGKNLETVTKVITLALAPLAMIIWGYEKIRDYLEPALAERLKYVPPDRITTPSPNVAGPAIEALRFTAHNDTLREMYANLLATAMDSSVAASAHPSFVEVLKQLTSDEVKIMELFVSRPTCPVVTLRANKGKGQGHTDVLRNFSLLGVRAGCAFPAMDQVYLDNLCRLGLLSVPHDTHLTDDNTYIQ